MKNLVFVFIGLILLLNFTSCEKLKTDPDEVSVSNNSDVSQLKACDSVSLKTIYNLYDEMKVECTMYGERSGKVIDAGIFLCGGRYEDDKTKHYINKIDIENSKKFTILYPSAPIGTTVRLYSYIIVEDKNTLDTIVSKELIYKQSSDWYKK